MTALETRIPPPAILILSLGVIELGAKFWPQASGVQTTASRVLVWLLLAWGAILGAAAIAQFLQAQTTVHPTHPDRTSVLVTTGIYRVTRNPMYLGLAMFVAAYMVHRMHPAGAVALLFFVSYITRFQIMPEERALRAKFGHAFDDYAARVRRWL